MSPNSTRPRSSLTTGKSPAGVDYYDAGSGAFHERRNRTVSGAATVPKGQGTPDRSPHLGSEGMLLLDIERERLELRRRDGNDVVVPMAPRRRRL